MLEGDERFEFLPAGEELGDNYVEPLEEDELEYTADIERLGFYSEDRVRLRNIEVTEEGEEETADEAEEPTVETEIDEESSHASSEEQTRARAGGNGKKGEKELKQTANRGKMSKPNGNPRGKSKKRAKSRK